MVHSTSLHVPGALPRTIIAVSKMKGSHRVETLRMAQKRYFRPKIAGLQLANHSALIIGTGSSLVPGPRLFARVRGGFPMYRVFIKRLILRV
ncbi:hypothetical protein NA56DRAFT_437572 [Hyaloscypha hepaticicola]|uniref:Uncharacterized protein n=1 Tax=Hyaloscypha hepaticicola TaxID=2082293 RepID=A0A2J6QGV9_9HELO|nr:hypothetical protein NA56DRAFT_437572 [Hyaloscypha hepaticicola]